MLAIVHCLEDREGVILMLSRAWRNSRLGTRLAFVSAAVFIAACSASTEPSHLTHLPGAWQWVSSLDVNSQELHTATTEGFTARLRFISDDERSGTFIYTRDGSAPVQGRYSIGSEDAPGNDFIRISTSIDFLTEYAWIAVGSDSLRLGGVFEGGFNSRYARVRD